MVLMIKKIRKDKKQDQEEFEKKDRKPIREGLTNQSVGKSGGGKTNPNSTPQVTAQLIQPPKTWAAFITITIITVVFFWILFPFYSCQLQLILDQRLCLSKDKKKGEQEHCYLPHNKHRPPYYPCKDGVGGTPPKHAKYAKCDDEHVKGPDMFEWALKTFWSFFTNIWNIMGGMLAIEAESQVEQQLTPEQLSELEGSSKAPSKHNKRGSKKELAATGTGMSTKHVGGALKKRVAMSKVDQTGRKTLLRSENAHNAKSRRAARASVSKLHTSTYTSTDDSTVELPTNLKYFTDTINKTLDYDPMSTHKNKTASLCCSKFSKYGLAEDVLKTCSSEGGSLADYPPFKWILPIKFGWPYNYLYDDPMEDKPTAYNPKSDKNNSVQDWVQAWLAKTQQRSWSTSRGIWSTIYGYFLPYLHKDLSAAVIGDRLASFIEQLTKDADASGNRWSTKANSKSKDASIFEERIRIKDKFLAIQDKFDKEVLNLPDEKPIDVLWKLLEPLIVREANNRKEQVRAEKKNPKKQAGGTDQSGIDAMMNSGLLDNIYLDLFIAMLKPESLRTTKNIFSAIFLNWGNGNWGYWFRWFVTLWMPMISGIVVCVSWWTGLFTTPFSSFNRYSSFILPVFGGAFTLTLFNMFWQPMEAFWYSMIGPFGNRDGAGNCPYNGSTYQMSRNFKAYWPINLFLTLAIIVTSLGTTLASEHIGNHGFAIFLSLLFPGFIVLKLLWSIIVWLWYL